MLLEHLVRVKANGCPSEGNTPGVFWNRRGVGGGGAAATLKKTEKTERGRREREKKRTETERGKTEKGNEPIIPGT